MRLKGHSKKRWNTGDVAYLGLCSACSSRAPMSSGMFFKAIYRAKIRKVPA